MPVIVGHRQRLANRVLSCEVAHILYYAGRDQSVSPASVLSIHRPSERRQYRTHEMATMDA